MQAATADRPRTAGPRNAENIIRDEHRSLSAVLSSLAAMLRGCEGVPDEAFFDVVRAMLFYIDEFPEKLHHAKESDLLFPRLVRRDGSLLSVVEQLEKDHLNGEQRVRELQHRLLAWELLGESRRAAFEQAAHEYIRFYLDHMRVEETKLLPLMRPLLTEDDWAELDAAFRTNEDPVATGQQDSRYERLFTRIVLRAPAPIGLGPAR